MIRSIKMLTMVLALGAGAIAFAATSTPVSAQTKILVHVFAPPNYPNNSHGWDYLKENIERDTQGRVVFEYTPGAVAPPNRNWDHVTAGIVDAAYMHTGFERNRLWLPELARLPGNTPSAEAMGVASWRTYKQFFEAADEFEGVKLLSMYTYTGEQIFTITKPIKTIDDLKGLKLRSGHGLAKDIFADLGIAPVPSLAAEIFPMVSKGVVDGMTGSASLATVLKVDQFLKYGIYYPGAFNALVWTPILNKEKWESIAPGDQAIMEKYFGEALARNVGRQWDRVDADAIEKMTAAGVEFHRASPEFIAEVQKRTAHFTEEWYERAAKRGVDGKAAMAYYLAQLKDAVK